MNRFEAWHRHLRLWLIPLAFCVLNILGLSIYVASYAGRVENLKDVVAERRAAKASLETERQASEAFLETVQVRQQQMTVLYDEQFSTAAERFTRVLSEVKRLARESGLKPERYAYPREELEGSGLVRRQIIFAVEGTYEQLRTFINFIELSDQFVVLGRIGLNESSGNSQNPILSIQLELSTIFVNEGTKVDVEEISS